MSRGGPSRWFLPALPFAAAAALAALLHAVAAFDPGFNPHSHFRTQGRCPKCHVVSRGEPVPDRFTGDSIDYCFSCHSKESLGRSHPIGVRPRDRYRDMRVPADFALDDGGRTMCLTCHNAHGPFVATVKIFPSQEPENPDRAPGVPFYYRTRFLRRSDPLQGYSVLCDACHEKL
ncbi:MAG: hypothetical protein ACM3NF_11045 [Gemmatimonadota bacterium]